MAALTLGSGDDDGLAGDGHDQVPGGSGADLPDCGPGVDGLKGQGQADVLLGGTGNHVSFGGFGGDYPGDGPDWRIGGPGADTGHAGSASRVIGCETGTSGPITSLAVRPNAPSLPEPLERLNESR